MNAKRFSALIVGMIVLLCTIPCVSANSPVILKDINEGASDSNPSGYVKIGDTFYFHATDAVNGTELRKSDGTEAGTQIVKDLCPGVDGWVTEEEAVGTTLYFVATDCTTGMELWKTDGTSEGTALVKDIVVGGNSSYVGNIHAVGSTLYFSANDGGSGAELWRSDGTEEGTVVVKDINTGSSSSNPSQLTTVGTTLYFTAYTAANGTELWKSDGTEVGTVIVKDIAPGGEGPGVEGLTPVTDELFFVAQGELWKSDGTEEGTVMVKDLNDWLGSNPTNLTVMNDMLYFSATDTNLGNELWKSDGTEVGTVLVKDITGDTGDSYPSRLYLVGNTIYFNAYSWGFGKELWKTDGTTEGTVMVKDIYTGSDHGDPQDFASIGGVVYFSAVDSLHWRELWRTDGTTEGTALVSDIRPGGLDSIPYNMHDFNGELIFTANTEESGTELMKLPNDITPPELSTISLQSGTTLSSPTPTITFKLDEPGICRISLTDQSFDQMTTNCSTPYERSATCVSPNLGNPGGKSLFIACKDIDGNKDTVGTNEQIDVTLSSLKVYQSADTEVTPDSPGSLLVTSINSLLMEDSSYTRTALSLTEMGQDSQLFKFSVDGEGVQLPKLLISWKGYGELTAGYPVTASVWNFYSSSWEDIGSQDCPVDCTLAGVKQGSVYIQNNIVWVWVKAKNQFILPEITNLSSGSPNENSTTFSWDTDIASSTEVAFDVVPHDNWEDYEWHRDAEQITDVGHTLYVNTLLPNLEYFFRVRSTSASNDSAISDEYSFWTVGSSCPYIFSYNGTGYTFVTESSSPGILSLGAKRIEWATTPFYKSTFYPNPLGNAAIPQGGLVPKTEGVETFYDVRATFELNEVNYLDEAALLVYDHSPEVEIYPDYRQNGVMHSLQKSAAAPFSVVDQSGANVKTLVATNDNKYWQSPLSTTPSYLEIKLLDSNETPANLKFVIKKGKEGDFFNSMPGDKLQIKNGEGNFVDVPYAYNIFFSQRDGALAGSIIVSNMSGIETKVVDLSGLTIEDNTIRLVTTNNKTQWDIDWIAVDTTPDTLGILTKVNPYSANLHVRGVSAKELSVLSDSKVKIMQPKYSVVSQLNRPGNTLTGNATKFGEVSSLLAAVDNKFVVLVQGDELSLRYEVPSQVENTERDFVYNTWDFHKPFSYALGDQIGPLPFNEMTKYPYDTNVEDYPYAANQAYINEYNTRAINWVMEPLIPALHHSLNTDVISLTLQDEYVAPSVTPTPSGAVVQSTPTPTPEVTELPDGRVVLNDYSEYLLGEGKTFELKKKQTVYFFVANKGLQEEHAATVTEVGEDYVIVTVASNPTALRLGINEEKLHDVTGEGVMDVSIKLEGINEGIATLVFAQVLPLQTTPTVTEIPKVTAAAPEVQANNSNGWIYAVLVAFGFILFLITKRRKKKE